MPNASTTGTDRSAELVQQAMLAQHVALVGLLDGEDLVVHADEPDDVPGDASGNLNQPAVGPLRQRGLERQVEQLGGRAQRRERVVAHLEAKPTRPHYRV